MGDEKSAPKIARKEFIERYCKRSGCTWDELRQDRSVCRCHCDEIACRGWAMVPSGTFGAGKYSSLDDYLPGGFCYHEGDPAPFSGPLSEA